MDMLEVEKPEMGSWNKWQVKLQRISAHAEGIRRKLRKANLSPDKKAILQQQLFRLEKQIIPRHLSQQPLS